jgi:hypothetical protein
MAPISGPQQIHQTVLVGSERHSRLSESLIEFKGVQHPNPSEHGRKLSPVEHAAKYAARDNSTT